jgi:hypothetical protein
MIDHKKVAAEATAKGVVRSLLPYLAPLIPPVHVSEQPQHRPGWCDSKGRCWGFNANEQAWRLRPAEWFTSGADRLVWRWLLPAGAIAVPPEQEATD